LSFTVNKEALKELLAKSKPAGSVRGKNEWLKMGVGSHTMRIAPPYSSKGNVVEKLMNHQGFKKGDRLVAPLCLNFLFYDRPDLFKEAVKKSILTQADYDQFKENGCPLCKIKNKLYEMKDEKRAKLFHTRTSYLWNVYHYGLKNLYKYSSSGVFFDAVMDAFGQDEKLFDQAEGKDFKIYASGEGLKRRYTPPHFMDNGTAFPETREPYNLDDAIVAGIQTFDTMAVLGHDRATKGDE
jgi:hypothetical protein